MTGPPIYGFSRQIQDREIGRVDTLNRTQDRPSWKLPAQYIRRTAPGDGATVGRIPNILLLPLRSMENDMNE